MNSAATTRVSCIPLTCSCPNSDAVVCIALKFRTSPLPLDERAATVEVSANFPELTLQSIRSTTLPVQYDETVPVFLL